MANKEWVKNRNAKLRLQIILIIANENLVNWVQMYQFNKMYIKALSRFQVDYNGTEWHLGLIDPNWNSDEFYYIF